MNNATAWLLTLSCLALLLVIWKMNRPKFIWAVKPIIAGFAAACFTYTNWGRPVANAILWFLGMVGGWFGIAGGVVAAGLIVVAIVVIWRDIAVDRVANNPAIVSIAALPLLALIAVGPIADAVQGATGNVARAGQSSIGRLIGGG